MPSLFWQILISLSKQEIFSTILCYKNKGSPITVTIARETYAIFLLIKDISSLCKGRIWRADEEVFLDEIGLVYVAVYDRFLRVSRGPKKKKTLIFLFLFGGRSTSPHSTAEEKNILVALLGGFPCFDVDTITPLFIS